MTTSFESLSIPAEQAGLTLAAWLRLRLPGQSWNQVRRLVESRRVRIDGDLCLDPARRLREGVCVELLARPAPRPHQAESIVVRHLDEHVLVVEKPSGMSTVRHPAERDWTERRKALSPTLEDLVPPLIARREGRPFARRASEGQPRKGPQPRLRVVHRLDKRRYLAVVPGSVRPQRIATWLVRDRGDGRRGSGAEGQGKQAVTHVDVVERLPGYTLLSCRLETGRTHQIRIHLAELGHPVCGDRVYHHLPGGGMRPDDSRAPRLALHAAELGFRHPATGEEMHWQMPLPADLEEFLARLRKGKKRGEHGDQVDGQ
jgi:23S rRNA pseudouridine1911/1915/1917 synthase